MTRESAADLERHADLLRARIASTRTELAENLRPRNLRDEAVETFGLRALTPQHLLEQSGREHPVATVLCGLAAGYLLFAAVRRSRAPTIEHNPLPDGPGESTSLATSVRSAVDKGVGKVRDRVLETADTLADAAADQLASALSRFGDAAERSVKDILEKTGAQPEARDAAAGLAKVVLAAAIRSGAGLVSGAR